MQRPIQGGAFEGDPAEVETHIKTMPFQIMVYGTDDVNAFQMLTICHVSGSVREELHHALPNPQEGSFTMAQVSDKLRELYPFS